MKEDYFNYYLLSYFNTDKEISLSQILHVLRGKRTPSMFYITEINQWHHGFSVDKKIQRLELQKIINTLINDNLLTEKKTGYLQTIAGKEKTAEYFETHYFPHKITRFSNVNLAKPFWERIQLYTQVFSEYSYQNTQYLPVIKNPNHQENVRQLFKEANKNIEAVFTQWVKEQRQLFEIIAEDQADIIGNFLTGHGRIGKTRMQIRKKLGMQADEFSFYFRDILEELIELIKQNRQSFPLLYQLLTQINEEFFLGLSQSTHQSYQLLKQGANIQQIARKRRIKENTVKEHLLEMAFILTNFPVQHFVSTEMYAYLAKQFENDNEYSFKKAMTEITNIEFYQYRLVELERIRST